MAQKNTRTAVDGVPLVIKGTKQEGGKSKVVFFHECCSCGLRHFVKMEHDGKNPDIKATFTREK